MDEEERMKRERRVEGVSEGGRKRWVTAAVSDAHGVSDEPHVFESDASSPSDI